MKILVIKPSSLGDVVHALPAVSWLRRRFPDASISWLVNEEYAGLVRTSPDVDDVIPFQRRRWGRLRQAGGFFRFLRSLRAGKFDVVVDLQGLFRSGFLAFCTGAPRRVGFACGREGSPWFYTEQVRFPPSVRHAVDKNMWLVRTAFAEGETGAGAPAAENQPATFPELRIPAAAQAAAAARMAKEKLIGAWPLIAVAPFTRWESKTWPPEFYARVLDLLTARFPGQRCWLLGSADQRQAAEQIVTLSTVAKPLNLVGETEFGELLELLRASHVVITTDSGPMHLAAAVNCPVAAIFGPTDPELTGPYGRKTAVLRGRCPEGPCFLEKCPRASLCHESVSAEAVAEAAASLLELSGK